MKIYKAYYDSRRFNFEAFGETEHEAIEALVIGLKKHTIQYKLNSNWWQYAGIEVIAFNTGFAYCDNEMIKHGGKS